MKNLSKWAKNHPISARIIIAVSHVLIAISGLCLGLLSYVYDFRPGNWIALLLGNVFFIAYFLYPNRRKIKGWFKYSYLRQKLLDFTLVITHFLIIATGVNYFAFSPNSNPQSTSYEARSNSYEARLAVLRIKPQVEKKSKKKSRSQLRKTFKKMKKKIKAELKQMKKAMKKQGNKKDARLIQALLILLTIGVALLLGVLIAALACEISCSGQEGLATAILLLGWTGVVWLSVIMIKKILQKGNKD